MKNFSSKKRGSFRRSFSVGVLGVVGAFIALVLVIFIFRGLLGGLSAFMASPLYGINTWFQNSGSALPTYLRDRASLEDKIHALEDTILALRGSAYTIERLEAVNAELEGLLGGNAPVPLIAAGVVLRPPQTPYDALLIDRGARDGIVDGAVVYFATDRAIGTVAHVYEGSAVVTLFSTPLAETTVYIVGPNIYTTAYGAGGGVIRVSVPQGIVLGEDDLVLLPGLAGGVLGKISAIESESTNPEQNAYIVHDVPLQSLRVVGVAHEAPPSISFEEARTNIEAQKSALRIDVPEGVLVDIGTSTASTSIETINP